MKKFNIYYFHNLNLSFKSAQTLQIIKDYLFLSRHGYQIYIYGEYTNENDLNDILQYIQNSNIHLSPTKKSKLEKLKNKISFLIKIYRDKNHKVVVTRHYKKIQELLFLKKFIHGIQILHEMHEESFPHLFKKNISKINILRAFNQVDGLIFTNYSQEEFYKQEYQTSHHNTIVLPNGTELNKFSNVTMKNNFVLTYVGQFNEWKNIELLFSALSLLDPKYTLKIAGGKNDSKSDKYIDTLIKKYKIDRKRVHYLGFIKNNEIENILKESNVLLLPLGDNIQSKYLTSPMKLFEYMSTKVPVLAIDYPTVNMITSEDEIYLVQNSAKAFAKKLIHICEEGHSNQQKISKMNQSVKKYSYEMRSINYDNFIQKL